MFTNLFRRSPSVGNGHEQNGGATGAGKPDISSPSSSDDFIDLTENARFTSLLMRNEFWRSRIVETITIDRALAARKNREYQVAPLVGVVKRFLEKNDINEEYARVVLPLGLVPKKIMVGFDLKVQLGEAFLLKRREIALREVNFIQDLAQRCSIPLREETREFLAVICEFAPGPWQQFRVGRHRICRNSKNVQRYLKEGLGFEIKKEELQSWRESADRIGGLMLKALNEPPDRDSAAENILLALPILGANASVSKAADVSDYITLLEEFIDMCEKNENIEGKKIIRMIAEYGKRFELLIDCKIPLKEPASVVVGQDVPLKIRMRGRCEFDVSFNDAASNYALIRVTDPDVQLKWRWRKISDLNGKKLPLTLLNLVRESKEDLAVYSSESTWTRPDRIKMLFRLRLPWLPKIVTTVFGLLILATIYPILHLADSQNLTNEDLGVFTVPTTLAAGLILIQQRTSLGMKLQRGLRLLIVGAIVALWIIVLLAYLRGWIGGSMPHPPNN